MGYFKHHAIVVHSWNPDYIKTAHAKAVEFGMSVSNITEPTKVNGHMSFLIAPDGSKEGWPDSGIGDLQREAWISWVKSDHGECVDWALVRFGGDNNELAELEDFNGKE